MQKIEDQITDQSLPSSFRDPSGYLYTRDGLLYRHIRTSYKEDYDLLMESGLYQCLVEEGMLVSHEEVELEHPEADGAYKTIKPKVIPFISYPYEWSFSQLKDAALTTLGIMKRALEKGMCLKDASAYNIQFRQGKPTLIDTLSFEKYVEGAPWVAYKQFCQHFLAPLALMASRDIRLQQLFRIYLDGVPLDLVSKLLPWHTWLRFSLLSHIHLHAKTQTHFSDKAVKISNPKMSLLSLRGLIDSLESAVKRLKWRASGTEWADYYAQTNYSDQAVSEKESLVANFVETVQPKIVWDLGANTGRFSRLASERGIQTIAFDVDAAAVERNYQECKAKSEKSLLPLCLDLTNPSSGIGWANNERMSMMDRGPADMVFALALIHHLAISNNVPLDRVALFLSSICRHLVIEFVPKTDSQVQRLLTTRADIFDQYHQEGFELAFQNQFNIIQSQKIEGTDRILYLMEKK